MAADFRHFLLHAQGFSNLVMNNNVALMDGPGEVVRDKAAYEREHFMDKTYRTPEGKLYIPARAIKKALTVACKFLPDKPKGTSFKSFAPFIEATVIVPEDAMLDVVPDKVIPWSTVVNLDPSKGPKGPRGPRCRPLIPLPWSAETTLTVTDDILTLEILQKIGEAAGKKCGFLDGRAIDMGRAIVTIKPLK